MSQRRTPVLGTVLMSRSLRPLFLSLWPWNQREVDRLRHMREDLSNEIGDCIGTYILKQCTHTHTTPRHARGSELTRQRGVRTTIIRKL